NGLTSVRPYADLPPLYFSHDVCDIDTNGFWFRNFQYQVEQERGLDFQEDLFSPFVITFDLVRFARARLIASTEPRDIRGADHYRDLEITRRQVLAAGAQPNDQLGRTLTVAANQFIAARASGTTIIAGYHWFGDWGRDTMIALPGLALTTNKPDVAKSILSEFAQHVDCGMLPNRFPDAG